MEPRLYTRIFLRARDSNCSLQQVLVLYYRTTICRRAVHAVVILSVCLSVCLSVTAVICVIRGSAVANGRCNAVCQGRCIVNDVL